MANFTWALGIKVTADGLMPCPLNDPGYFTEIEGRAYVNGSGITNLCLIHFGGAHMGFARWFDGDEIGGRMFDQVCGLLEEHNSDEIADAIAEWKADGVNQEADYRRKVSA